MVCTADFSGRLSIPRLPAGWDDNGGQGAGNGIIFAVTSDGFHGKVCCCS